MPKAVWDDTGTRRFEAGVDHGMLYVGSFAGVPWNGLVSVSEIPSGGDAREYFLDGDKYLNLPGPEEYTATVKAFSSPPEFAPCAGFLRLSPGLFADRQPRKQFGFSYRSLMGDDLQGTSAGYKIHLIYNALAKVSGFTHSTGSEKATVNPYSWEIAAIPETVQSYRPTTHFIVDSRKIPSATIAAIEDILYGTVSSDPRLLTAQELVTMVGS